jgi:hypothetical protein
MDEPAQPKTITVPKSDSIHSRQSCQQRKCTTCIDNVGFRCSNGSMYWPLLSTNEPWLWKFALRSNKDSIPGPPSPFNPSLQSLRCWSGDGVPRVLPLHALHHLCPPQHVPGGLTRRQCSFLSPGTATIQGRAPNRSQGVSYRQGSNSSPQGRHHQPRRPKLDRQGPPR